MPKFIIVHQADEKTLFCHMNFKSRQEAFSYNDGNFNIGSSVVMTGKEFENIKKGVSKRGDHKNPYKNAG